MKSFIRVNRKALCPVCGHGDWCSVSANRTLAFCMRIEEGSIKRARNGAFIHRLNEQHQRVWDILHQTPRNRDSFFKAPPKQLDKVYRVILDSLLLRESHQQDLRLRGLSNETIKAHGYKSTPSSWSEWRHVNRAIETLGSECEGVPGLYVRNRQWQMVETSQGFYCPFVDEDGCIVGLQLRHDYSDERQPKYKWISSGERYKGTAIGIDSGSPLPVHFAGNVKGSGFVVLTEGSLKANIIHHLSNAPVVGIGGSNNFPMDIGTRLYKLLKYPRRVLIAFDRDWLTNDAVFQALKRLEKLLRSSVLSTRWLTWNGAKGLDDYLVLERERGCYEQTRFTSY